MTRARPSLLLLAAAAVLSAAPQWVNADSETVTVGPKDTNPEAIFYSNASGEPHTLTVESASGWTFVSGPSLHTNPGGLWTLGGGNTFNMLAPLGDENDGAGEAEVKARIDATLRREPTGEGGGGGPPPEISVTVDLETKYFSMEFTEPVASRSSAVVGEPGVPVGVTLLNAEGETSSGNVALTITSGNASVDEGSFTYNGGLAAATFSVSNTATAGADISLKAEASDIDITDNETADGKNTKSLTAVEPELEILIVSKLYGRYMQAYFVEEALK